MKNLLITLALLFSASALADAPVMLSGLEVTKGQVVRVDVDADNYYVTMVRVTKDTTELEVEFEGLAAGTYDARITVYDANIRKAAKGEFSIGEIVDTIEAEIEIK
jgi:hypothetical protein